MPTSDAYALCVCILLTSFLSVVRSEERWITIPGPTGRVIKHVSVSSNILFGVDNTTGEDLTPSDNNVVYCVRPCFNGNWIEAVGQLDQLDSNDIELWGVNDRNEVYKRAIRQGTVLGRNWERIRCGSNNACTKMSIISASNNSNNTIWGVSIQGAVVYMQCHYCNSENWVPISPQVTLTQIDAGAEEVWGVNASSHIFKRPVDGSGEWSIVPGEMRYISASGRDYIWGISPNDSLYNCEKPCTGDWQYIGGGSFEQVDAGYNSVCGVTTDNILLCMNDHRRNGIRFVGTIKIIL